MKKSAKSENILFSFILSLLALPFALLLLVLCIWDTPTWDWREARELKQLPEFPNTSPQWLEISAELNDFFNDQFFGRVLLINLRTNILLAIKSETIGTVFIGQQGWFFRNHKETIEQYQSPHYFTNEELERWHQYFKKRKSLLQRQGKKYLLVIAPNKHSAYQEYLPEKLARSMLYSSRKQLSNYLEEKGDIDFIDLTDSVIAAKDRWQDPLYQKTGTHWNLLGAYAASEPLMRKISDLLNIDVSSSYTPEQFNRGIRNGFELAGWLSLDKTHREPIFSTPETTQCEAPVLIENLTGICKGYKNNWCEPQAIRCQGEKRVLVFRDSFFNKLIPLVSPSFSETTYINNPGKSFRTFKFYVKLSDPDLVIEQVIERMLSQVPRERAPETVQQKTAGKNNDKK